MATEANSKTGESRRASRVGYQAIIPNRRDVIVCSTKKEAQEIVDGYNSKLDEAQRFHPRWVNAAAITVDSRTISTQFWCKDQQDIYDAERAVLLWATENGEQLHGRILCATMYDMHTKELRRFENTQSGLKEVRS